jgi:hypothetical protein
MTNGRCEGDVAWWTFLSDFTVGKSFDAFVNDNKLTDWTSKIADHVQPGKDAVLVRLVEKPARSLFVDDEIIEDDDVEYEDISIQCQTKGGLTNHLRNMIPNSGPTGEMAMSFIEVFNVDMQDGLILVDSGASETVGSPEALDTLAVRAFEKFPGKTKVKINKKPNGPRFKMANGAIANTYSQVLIDTPLGTFSAYSMEAQDVPILMSIKALRALEATINFTTDEMSFTAHGANPTGKKVVRKLQRTSKGHLTFDILQDDDLLD